MSIKSEIRRLGRNLIYGRNYRELQKIRKERDQLRKLFPAAKNSIAHVDLKNQSKAMRLLGNLQIIWILKNYGVNCVLDVGANVGQYGASLRKSGYEGHIVSFEPVPQFAAKLMERSADDPKWHVFQTALGSYDGEIQMRVQGQSTSAWTTSSSFGLENYKHLAEHVDDELTTVSINRLETLFPQILELVEPNNTSPRIYLKMDSQGFDIETFRGVGQYLDLIVAMQSELALIKLYEEMPGMAEALNEYQSKGFEPVGFFPVVTAADGRAIEFDGTLVRPDRFIGDP